MSSERPKDPTEVETHEFRRSSLFSRGLRRLLRGIIIPLSEAGNREAYRAQFAEASRNVEIATEQLLKLSVTHPWKTAHVIAAIRHWISTYFRAQGAAARRDRYLVYTRWDEGIPFVPEEDIMYTYMLAQIAYVAGALAAILPGPAMAEVARAFMEMNALGAEVFDRFPTVMPRFKDHRRLSLHVIQRVDQPLNCCPSLHIAYSILLDNLAGSVIAPHPAHREVYASIRYSTGRMFNSVLYTKQHSLLDVAFGILCARLVYEARFRDRFGREFSDFTSLFDTLKGDHPAIPYDRIAAMYAEAVALHARAGTLVGAVGAYLEEHGFPRIAPEDEVDGRSYDVERREMLG